MVTSSVPPKSASGGTGTECRILVILQLFADPPYFKRFDPILFPPATTEVIYSVSLSKSVLATSIVRNTYAAVSRSENTTLQTGPSERVSEQLSSSWNCRANLSPYLPSPHSVQAEIPPPSKPGSQKHFVAPFLDVDLNGHESHVDEPAVCANFPASHR